MKIEFDPAKSERNAQGRGLPFSLVDNFDWERAVFAEDTRFEYPEARFVALGYVGDRLYFVCFAPVTGGIRVISFRKANEREVLKYEKEKAANRRRR